MNIGFLSVALLAIVMLTILLLPLTTCIDGVVYQRYRYNSYWTPADSAFECLEIDASEE